MGDLPAGAVIFLVALSVGAVILVSVVLSTMYDAAKEAREFYRRANQDHRAKESK